MEVESIANAGDFSEVKQLSQEILDAISLSGFSQMTAVQAATIPLFLSYKDVVVQAVTGSGKTLAFVIPILEMIRNEEVEDMYGLVLSPTRELATQIYSVFCSLASNMDRKLGIRLFVGGTSVPEDVELYSKEKGQIIIGTPGRIEALFNMNAIPLKHLNVLVLDEADKLLEYSASITNILKILPKQRRTALLSATMNDAIDAICQAGLRNPSNIHVSQMSIPNTLQIFYMTVEHEDRLQLLLNNLKSKTIVYFATCSIVDYFYLIFSKLNIKNIFSLHGKMDPKRRLAVYSKFKESASAVLLTTDISARGLDIPDIDNVIQFDAPQDPKQFSHRCGRTARAGKSGQAVIYLSNAELVYIDFLKIRKIPLNEIEYEPVTNSNIHDRLKEFSKTDRAVYEAGIKAFTSWTRFYMKHEASYIFNLSSVDLGKVAKGFGILRMPRMPELKKFAFTFTDEEVDFGNIPYLNPQREKQRLENSLKEKKTKKRKFKESVAWSKKKEIKEKRDVRKMKKVKKKEAIARAASEDISKAAEREAEWEELKHETKLMKMEKKTKVVLEEI